MSLGSSNNSLIGCNTDGLLALEAFFKQINDHLKQEGKSYAYQIIKTDQPLYDGIGTLHNLLGYGTEVEMMKMMVAIGLCRSRRVISCENDRWNAFQKNIDGMFYEKQYGNSRRNYLVIGGLTSNY